MTSDHVFGSDELTPDMVRGASFAEHDGRIDASEVRTFLDRVASSLEVFMSADAPTALRAEFARNAEIAQQVLDAGQNASEQLRRQAAEDAKRILDEAREATHSLRSSVDQEIEQARVQVEAMRGGFTQELRDLYDRIGASLYRFERAAAESQLSPIQEPQRLDSTQAPAPVATPAPPSAPAPAFDHALPPINEQVEAITHDASVVGADPAGGLLDSLQDVVAGTPELPEGAKPPAWQQLPAEAYAPPTEAEPALEATSASDRFEPVVEDEPLAPGEPLVDLRELATQAPTTPEPSDEVPSGDAGGSWLDSGVNAGDELPPVAPSEQPAAADTGSWLEVPLDPAAGSATADPALSHDDALAEALIASGPLDNLAPTGATTAEPGAPTDPAGAWAPQAQPAEATAASADAMAVRQLILDSLAAGQSRESVETYLRDQLGMFEPGALIDAALASAGSPDA